MLRRFGRQVFASPSNVINAQFEVKSASFAYITRQLSGGVHPAFREPAVRHRVQPTRGYSSGMNNRFRGQYDVSMLGLIAATAAGSLLFAYMMKDYLGPRETEILQPVIDLKKNSHHGHIVDADDFTCIGPKPTGELSGCIVKHNATNETYLKKGAKSKKTLVKEFIIANFLTMLRPGEQPPSLIMEEKHVDGKARLYTLSKIYPNSMDLKEFISQPDYAEKIAAKPIIGFEVALASDMLFAKQADMKLANYVIIERDEAFYVVSIDHEMSGCGIHGKRVFVDDIKHLYSHIRDISTLISGNEDDPAEFVNSEAAQEFIHLAIPHMKIENVERFYETVAAANIKVMTDLIDDIDTQDGVITREEGDEYLNYLKEIVSAAQHHCEIKKVNDNARKEMEDNVSNTRYRN